MTRSPLGDVDRPNSYIGRSVPRPDVDRLLAGRGTYVSDLVLPRMVHAVFVRSPFAHARIRSIDVEAARAAAGVAAVVTGREMAAVVSPWVGVLSHLKGLKSAPQHAIAVDRATWAGEAVAAVVARSRAEAEDAAERVVIDWEPLDPVTDAAAALEPGATVIHPDLGDNLAFERAVTVGDPDRAFAEAAHVVSARFDFNRHTGVTLEPRAVVADWDAGSGRLTVYQGTQAPHMVQNILATHLGLEETQVRVVCRDVGGSFGIKVHIYADEMATAGLSRMLGRPVKFVADRSESFVTDIHARDHVVDGRMAVDVDGRITAIEIDDLTGVGPYSMYPRTSAVEANQVVNLTGGPYRFGAYRARARVAFQNKTVTSQYRAVGHPIAAAVTEGLVDLAARAAGLDPVEIRRRNLIPDDAYPTTGPTGLVFEGLSHHACLDRLLATMDYDGLRRDQAEQRRRGVHRGIGLASFIEITNPGAAFYGVGGARISSQDGACLRLDATGALTVQSSVTEQGQGTIAILAQIAATAVGLPIERVRVTVGDTDATPYGGGTWASRGAGIGGEAALQAGKALKANILAVAGIMLQADPTDLDVAGGAVIDRASGAERLPLSELARVVYFRPDTLPRDFQAELMAVRHYVPRQYPFAFTNGVQASWLEVDDETGFVRLLGHWVVEDCGRVINPRLVDEQIRGGVVQGIGAALFEHCLYDADGQLRNGSMADYLVPMAAEMPDIGVAHVETPTAESELGAKGAGEAGTAGAPAAVMNAVNDALSPFGVTLTAMPFTPDAILGALGRLS
jgi:carbon-monoxide dehydrogenase large subunit